MSYDNKTLTLSPNASFRNLGEEGIVLMANNGQLYSTSETGSAFLDAIQNNLSFQEALDCILEEYEIDRQSLQDDLTELADFLVSENVLIVK